jgi:hypothetical protein
MSDFTNREMGMHCTPQDSLNGVRRDCGGFSYAVAGPAQGERFPKDSRNY